MKPSGKTYVSADGMLSLRTKPMDEDKAKRLVAMWQNCPSFLDAVVEPLPNSTRVCVCYVPATLESQEAMTEAFLQGELDKAEKQGPEFRYMWNADGCHGWVFNPTTNGNYKLFRSGPGDMWKCSCHWSKRAGICKHLIEAATRGLIEPPAEVAGRITQKERTAEEIRQVSAYYQPITQRQREADWD